MQNGKENHLPPIVQAMRRIIKIVYPLQVKVSYRGDQQAILTLPTYPAKTGELHILYLGPERGQGWRIKASGAFERYLNAARGAVRSISRLEGEGTP